MDLNMTYHQPHLRSSLPSAMSRLTSALHSRLGSSSSRTRTSRPRRSSTSSFSSASSSSSASSTASTPRLTSDPTIANPRRQPISSPPQRHPHNSSIDIRARALHTIDAIRRGDDPGVVSRYVSPRVTVQHDDDAPCVARREDFAALASGRSDNAAELNVVEALVDHAQRKVLVRREVEDWEVGRKVERVDMMVFDGDGWLVSCSDWERVRNLDEERD